MLIRWSWVRNTRHSTTCQQLINLSLWLLLWGLIFRSSTTSPTLIGIFNNLRAPIPNNWPDAQHRSHTKSQYTLVQLYHIIPNHKLKNHPNLPPNAYTAYTMLMHKCVDATKATGWHIVTLGSLTWCSWTKWPRNSCIQGRRAISILSQLISNLMESSS